MHEKLLRILQVTTSDTGGGAEKIAMDLFHFYRALGHRSWLAVGRKQGKDPDVFAIDRNDEAPVWRRIPASSSGPAEGSRLVSRLGAAALRMLTHPRHELGCRLGIEDFDYPNTKDLLERIPCEPDIVHCHNLHGGYFDLRFLPQLSRRVPVLLTLHDAWLLSGHCAHSFDCERWKSGCGRCPDLTIYPGISRDATAFNWRRKRKIFSQSSLWIATPSQWLMDKVEQSMLRPSIVDARVIRNGIDLEVFHAADQGKARAALELPHDCAILLFSAHMARNNVFKDYATLECALERIERPLMLICLGEESGTKRVGPAEVRFVPFQREPKRVAQYHRAADIYVHASRADTFPCSVLEALACGTPVIGTAVGGIPEQIRGLKHFNFAGVESNLYGAERATGILVPPEDPQAIAQSVRLLLDDTSLLKQLGRNGARDARDRFDIALQAARHLQWYREAQAGFRARQEFFETPLAQPVQHSR